MRKKDELMEIKRRAQESHIFTGEEPNLAKESKKKQIKFQTSNIMFNDSYVEKPPVKEERKKRYLFEQKIKAETGYSDDLKKEKDTVAFKRKIKDSYINNPMKIYNAEETEKYNEGERKKYANRTKAFNNVFGSEKCKRTLGGINRSNMDTQKLNSDKVTSNSFNITQNAMILNKDEKNQQVPYYGKRHFITCNNNGKSLTYY